MNMRRFGIEQLSVFGLPPVAFVGLAADLGCGSISLGLVNFGYNPHGYAPFSLRTDLSLRAELKSAMRDRDVAIALGEGCNIRAGQDIREMAGEMDIFAELGAERLNAVSLDPDLGRSLDQLAIFAEMAAERGMVSTVELCPVLTINSLDSAMGAVRHVGRNDFRLLIDTMHLARSGATAADLAAIDPALIDYVQLCDAPLDAPVANYMTEASLDRLVPGEGELPLQAYLAVIPPDVTVSLEIPLRSQASAGIGPEARMKQCLDAMQPLLPQVTA